MAVATPKVIVGRIYMKPLVPKGFEDRIDPERILKTLKQDILKRIRKSIQSQDTFSLRAKTALAKAVKIEVRASSVRVTVNHPAWRPMVLGMKEQQMKWLSKAKAPIPIITDTGEIIFRTASARSLANGKWVHPGYQRTNLIEKARRDARAFVRKKVVQQVEAMVREMA